MIKWVIRISLFFVFCSCNIKSQRILTEISLLQSKPIKCGSNKMMHDGMFKYIIYSDSTRCTPCAINKMYIWNSLLEYSKNYNGQLKFYFIFCPARKDLQEMKFALIKNSRFHYPVVLDTLGEFEKLNSHLPRNNALHAFLLDENNNVVLVGDPLHNKEIKNMFYKIVEEKLGKP